MADCSVNELRLYNYIPDLDDLCDTLSELKSDAFYFQLFSEYLTCMQGMPSSVVLSFQDHVAYLSQHVDELGFILGFMASAECVPSEM